MRSKNQTHLGLLWMGKSTTAVLTLALAFGMLTPRAQTQTFQVLHSFGFGTDGTYPSGNLIQDSAGTFYGTTFLGGSFGIGTVFSLDSSGKERVLYNFTGGNDGSHPWQDWYATLRVIFTGPRPTGPLSMPGPCSGCLIMES